MKWITHQLVAVGTAIVLEMPPIAIAATFFGSVLPDIIDQKISRWSSNPQKTFNSIHRGLSHWFGWYALLYCFAEYAFANPRSFGIDVGKEVLHILSGLGFGGLFHILLDMCTPSGVPLSPFKLKRRATLKLFSTGSVQEYMFLALAMFILVAWGYDDFPKIVSSVQDMF